VCVTCRARSHRHSSASTKAKAETRIAHDRIAHVETEANERLSRAWAEIEDRFIRLKADLAQAEGRAERAEQLLVLIRREIENNLMPPLAEQTL
jgi:predicted phage-related endonuclease